MPETERLTDDELKQMKQRRLNRLIERLPQVRPADIARVMAAASDLLLLSMSYYSRVDNDRKETEEMKELRAALKKCGLTTWSFKEFLREDRQIREQRYQELRERRDQELRDRQDGS